ncbi:hypothetical protein [Jiella sonneratiae]|nr:hypothetical protein [Jiella sonneratiae]
MAEHVGMTLARQSDRMMQRRRIDPSLERQGFGMDPGSGAKMTTL